MNNPIVESSKKLIMYLKIKKAINSINRAFEITINYIYHVHGSPVNKGLIKTLQICIKDDPMHCFDVSYHQHCHDLRR